MKNRLTHWQTTIPGVVAIAGAIALAVMRPDIVPGSAELLVIVLGLAGVFARGTVRL